MQTLIMHIGMDKTGSSSIQKTLREYDDGRIRYARLGGRVHYARFGNQNHSVPLYTIFSEQRESYHLHVQQGFDSETINQMKLEFEQVLIRELEGPAETLVISGEGLSTLEISEVRKLGEFVGPYVNEVCIIAYARDPISFASSAFQERLKAGEANVQLPVPNFRGRFEPYLETFGAERVVIAEFAPETFPHGSVVEDFCSRIGLSIKNTEIHHENTSLSDETARLLFLFNREGPHAAGSIARDQARQRFIHHIEQHFKGEPFRLPAFPVPSYVRDDVNWLAKETGIDFSATIDGSTETDCSVKELEQDLLQSRVELTPRLADLLRSMGIKVSDEEDIGMQMNRLYDRLLAEVEREKERRQRASISGHSRL